MASSETYDAIVVGAGWAGVTAARDLTDRSYRVLIVEARDRLGGRSWYRPFADTDIKVEMGGGWVDPLFNPALMAEIDRYDIPISESPAGRTQISIVGDQRFEGSSGIDPDHLAALERALVHMVNSARRLTPDVPLDVQDVADLDISVTEFLEPLELPLDVTEVIGSWVRLNTGCLEEEVSALHMLSWVADIGYSAISIGQIPSHRFEKGTASLIDAMVADASPDIALSSPVDTIRRTAEGVEVITHGGETYKARGAVFAIPLNCWGDVEFDPKLSVGKAKAAEIGQAGASRKVWALTTGPSELWTGVGGRSAPIDILAAEYRLPEGDLVVGFTNQYRDVDLLDRGSVEQALRRFAPEVSVTKVDHYDWVADPYSKGTWFAGRPNCLSRHASALARTEGPIAFAGSDVSPIFRGWMTGAVHSGGVAAANLARVLGD